METAERLVSHFRMERVVNAEDVTRRGVSFIHVFLHPKVTYQPLGCLHKVSPVALLPFHLILSLASGASVT